jgi:hypothetical protein
VKRGSVNTSCSRSERNMHMRDILFWKILEVAFPPRDSFWFEVSARIISGGIPRRLHTEWRNLLVRNSMSTTGFSMGICSMWWWGGSS